MAGKSFNSPTLLVVMGPTGVGKTDVSINIAKKLDSVIISADSRQFYKEMKVGTAKPSLDQLNLIPHYFIDSHSIKTPINAGTFSNEALKLLKDLFEVHKVVILTGGSGLYIWALCEGLSAIPKVPDAIRNDLNQLYALNGLEPLLEELRRLDTKAYQQIDRQNPQRIIRALEVIRHTGQTFSDFKDQAPRKRFFNSVKIGLELPRPILYKRIDARMDGMINSGLFEEAKALYQYRDLEPLQTVGYQEIFGYLESRYDREEAIRLLKRNSRRYAKRQMTWFKKETDVHWFDARNENEILEWVDQKLISK